MNNDRMDELNEQLEDAYFTLLLNRYAEIEGRKQQEEYEKAAAQNELPPIPEDLDAKCRDLIRKSSVKGRRKQLIQRTLPRIGRIAAVMLVVIGLCTTLVFSVDALRIPVMNFIIDQYEQFTSIGKDVHAPATEPTDSSHENADDAPLTGILPGSFKLIRYKTLQDGTVNCYYQSEDGCIVFFETLNYDSLQNVDSENAITESINIMGHAGLFINKGNELTLLWYDSSVGKTIRINSTGLSQAELWNLAEAVASKYHNIKETNK